MKTNSTATLTSSVFTRVMQRSLQLLVFLFLCAGLQNGKATTVADPALNGNVTYSSTHVGGGWAATNIVDGVTLSNGSTDNGWSSDNSLTVNHTEWIEVDMGSKYPINNVVLYPCTNYFPINFTIQISPDNVTWTTVATETNYPMPVGGVGQSFPFNGTSARYILVTGTSLPYVASDYRMQLTEIEAHEDSALGGIVSYSSTHVGGGWAAADLVDGVTAPEGTGTDNGWSSDNSLTVNHTEWAEVNMGASTTLGQVVLYPAFNYFPINFTIQISPDNTNWTTVATETNYPAPVGGIGQAFSFASTSARYVKVTGTSLPYVASNYRMQFTEIVVPGYTDNAWDGAVSYSSTYSSGGWAPADLVDGITAPLADTATDNGWTSNNSLTANHTEWVEVDMGTQYSISEVSLVSAMNYFPINFTIQVSPDNTTWTTVATETSYPAPAPGVGQNFPFTAINARYILVTGTSLPYVASCYRMQFTELAAYSLPPTTANLGWRNVFVGGGGAVTGIVADPNVNQLFYMRTDVGGAYRWNSTTLAWVPITDGLSSENSDNDYGMESLAVDPSTANKLYILTGEYTYDPARIFMSTNAGSSWSQMATPSGLYSNSNGSDHSRRGEKLAVDPNNSNVLYLASEGLGLWVSTNGASSWTQVDTAPGGSAFPSGIAGEGLSFVTFDKGGGTTGGVSSIIYVGVFDSGVNGGVWKSTNGGANWTLMTGGLNTPARGAVGSDGMFFATYFGGYSHNAGVYQAARAATGLTACNPPNTATSFCGLAIDPTNAQNVYVSQTGGAYNLTTYFSTNEGSTWTAAGAGQGITNYATRTGTNWFGDIAQLMVDPNNTQHLWMADWGGVTESTSVQNTSVAWNYIYQGDEEIVPLMLKGAPSGAPLLSGDADVNGEQHLSVTAYPAQAFTESSSPYSYASTTALDFCEANPNVWARVIDSFVGGTTGLYSTNDGSSWSYFGSMPGSATGGRIAVSATNSSNFVWIPEDGTVYYTTNSGSSWGTASGPPAGGFTSTEFGQNVQALASDRVNGNFYLDQNVYASPTGHAQIWISSNGGANWTTTGTVAYSGTNANQYEIFTAPGSAGEIWLDVGYGSVWKSTNAGASFSYVPISSVSMMAYGIPAPGHANAALFLDGGANGGNGIYRSDDDGNTWKQIGTTASVSDGPEILGADRQTFGRCYIGSGGRGIWVGDSN